METCCDYTDELMYVSTDEIWLKNRIMRFMESHPGEVTILKEPADNQGTLYCIVPASWLKITPPTKRNMSDDQRQALSERMRKMKQEGH